MLWFLLYCPGMCWSWYVPARRSRLLNDNGLCALIVKLLVACNWPWGRIYATEVLWSNVMQPLPALPPPSARAPPALPRIKSVCSKPRSSGMWKSSSGKGTSTFLFLFSDSVSLHCAPLPLLVLKPLPICCQDLGPVNFSVTGSARETRMSSVSWNNSFLVVYLDWPALWKRWLPLRSQHWPKELWITNESSHWSGI